LVLTIHHQCQQSKKEIVIIKLDFTKTFDMIQHSAITQMMHQLGFNDKWISWTSVTPRVMKTLIKVIKKTRDCYEAKSKEGFQKRSFGFKLS
jgi:hypothetical protein